MEEKHKKLFKTNSPKTSQEKIFGLDLSFQGLKSLNNSLFLLNSIKELYLNNNELESIPKDFYKLKNLEKLNLSYNKLRSIPGELGKAVSLKELYLNDNYLSNIPMELGSLYNLEILNLSNNPLVAPFNSLSRDKNLINFCRENNTNYPQPMDRAWIDTILKREMIGESISIGTYNILSNFYASKCTYAPTWVINPELRREAILQNILSYNVDILCLQEIETISYSDFYKNELETKLEYDSVFYPKGRSLTLPDKKTVDGCATFWRRSKFKLIEQVNIDFYQKILTDQRFSNNQDILNRHSRKDNIALITILERLNNSNENINSSNNIIVVNTHLFWDPEFSDVKLFQVILILEELERIKLKYKSPSIIFLGDFNSLKDSGVYNLIIERKVDGNEFNLYDYSPFNNGFRHTTRLYDSYMTESTFTNFTPTFKDTIDYIFYNDSLTLISILSPVEEEYTENCVGLPNIHFPSDHIFIGAKFNFKNMPRRQIYK